MDYRDQALHMDGVAVAEVAARVGTPCYIYSVDAILANYRA